MTSNPDTVVQDGAPSQGGFTQGGFIDTSIPVAPKRLIVCCDGTWQSSVSGLKNIPSNVTRLARSIAGSGKDADGKVWQQIVFYDSGIGTGELSKGEKDRQGGFGIGFVGNVIEAYNFIVLNYQPGDQIFCFGFSRGAYTARAVAGLINDIGVISPKAMQDFPDLYALYQKHDDSFTFRKSTVYREWAHGVLAAEQPPRAEGGYQEPAVYDKPPHGDAPESSRVVQVVGVFDTVGSLGIPDMTWTKWNLKFLEKVVGIPQPGFHNVALSPCKNPQILPQQSALTPRQIYGMHSTRWLSMSVGGRFRLRYGSFRLMKNCVSRNLPRPMISCFKSGGISHQVLP